MPATVRLEPLDAAGRAAFLEREAQDYADAKARAGLWPRAEALLRSREEIRSFVESRPSGIPHEFLRGADADGETVGWLWVGPVPEERAPPSARWLFQITVPEPFRGRGYGRALLQALEAYLRDRGVREIRLNVFAWNRVAIALYASSGYEVASATAESREMRKRLP